MKTAAQISNEIRRREQKPTQEQIVNNATEMMFEQALRSKTVDIKFEKLETDVQENLKKAGFNVYSSKTGKVVIVVP